MRESGQERAGHEWRYQKSRCKGRSCWRAAGVEGTPSQGGGELCETGHERASSVMREVGGVREERRAGKAAVRKRAFALGRKQNHPRESPKAVLLEGGPWSGTSLTRSLLEMQRPRPHPRSPESEPALSQDPWGMGCTGNQAPCFCFCFCF